MAKIKFNEAQLEIINHREGNMIVSASAGSGKTTVMLQRVLDIIEEGTPIDRIVILAFNNSIAAEIRGKIYKKIVERLSDPECTQQEFLKEQLDRLPFCNIITNDSYCNRTSSEFFQILGIDPNANILGELEKNIMFSNGFYKALAELKEEDGGEIFELSLKFGGDSQLLGQVQIIHNYVSTQAGGMEWLDNVTNEVYTDDISQSSIMYILFDMVEKRIKYSYSLIEEILTLLSCEQKMCEPYIAFFEELNKIKNIKTYQEFYERIKILELVKKARKSKKVDIDWDRLKSLHSNLQCQLNAIKDMFSHSLSDVQDIHSKTKKDIELLVDLYKMTRVNYTQAKTENSKFDFNDFPQNVIKLLNNPDIRREIVQRYDYICVDEYQDTNYAQEEIYTKISSGNNLFMVGDSKQSIYRFRLSEPKILLEKFEDYNQNPSHGKTKKLDLNYRSDQGIVDFANDIFNEVMTKEFGGIDYKLTDQLKYGADYKVQPTRPSFEIHLFEAPERQAGLHKNFEEVYSVRDDIVAEQEPSMAYREGQFIADKIEEIVKTYTIYDTELKDVRKVQYSDIALLARTGKNNVREVVKAIQERLIPIDVAPLLKEEGVYEIEIVKDILRLVANDMQDFALAAALVSFWVGMDYNDLLAIREKNPKTEYFWQAVQAERENNEYIQKLYSMLEDLRLRASYSTIKEIAERIVFDFGFDQHILSEEGGDYKLSALKTYLSTLSDLSADCSLNEYVSTLGGGKMEIKGGADGNMVRAMTIHKSKGLEFPVVFICNIDEPLTNSSGLNAPKLRIDKEVGIAINYFNKENMTTQSNLAFDILSEKNKMEDKSEAMRLFYVALTRPKNHVILTGKLKSNSLNAKNPFDVNSFLDWVVVARENNDKIASAICLHNEDYEDNKYMQRYSFQKYCGEAIPIIDKYLNFEYPHKDVQNASIKYTVTEINKQGGSTAHCFEEEEYFANDDFATNDRAKRGTNYHAVLENIDLNATTKEQVEQQLGIMVNKNIVTAEDLQQINIAEIVEIMNSEVMQFARVNKCYREKEFTMKLSVKDILGGTSDDKVLVQGIIDLLIVGEQVWVVDYKKTDESTKVLRERYKTQLEVYVKAVENAIARKVDRAMLLVIGRCEIIDII